jgi:hypothetical protein
MAHVTFIHGIGNKPAPDALHRIWMKSLADGGLDLIDLGVTSRHVYWSDVLYPEPDSNVAAYESLLESRAEGIDASGDAETPRPETPEERAFLEGLRGKLTGVPDGAAEYQRPGTEPGGDRCRGSSSNGFWRLSCAIRTTTSSTSSSLRVRGQPTAFSRRSDGVSSKL